MTFIERGQSEKNMVFAAIIKITRGVRNILKVKKTSAVNKQKQNTD